MKEIPFGRFGIMLDCSRNAVMNVESLKRWIDTIADLGYNMLMLYTEDTYEVNDNPYFGYLRGRYSKDELKEIDKYAASKGVELMPCIQTLAHLNAAVRWPEYGRLVDCNDILLAGEPDVYKLIDNMFATISSVFTSKQVNIGMDEAHMIGRGRYYDLHGDTDRSQILIDHIKKVAEIGKKYGLKLCMWSDMFFRLILGGSYYGNAKIDEKIKAQIPDNVELIYWDYYSTDKKHYADMIKSHQAIKDGTWFAGGIWTWTGFAPHNEYSMKASEAAITECRKNGIDNVFLTMWGDNGAETSKFSTLPALFYASEIAKGHTSKALIKKAFKEKYGIPFDSFMNADLGGTPNDLKYGITNAEKYLLYNDPFMGILDSTIAGGENEQYAAEARKLSGLAKNERYGYVFATLKALCDVLSVKAELGVKTRNAYDAKDIGALKALIGDYKKLSVKLVKFYECFKYQWYKDNKGQGFDVEDIRLGGLMQRVKHCTEMLEKYVAGEIDHIDELDERLLDVTGAGENMRRTPICYNNWSMAATANVV